MKKLLLSLMLSGLGSMAAAETVIAYSTLSNNAVYEIEKLEVLEDGTVILIVANKNTKLPTHICHLHRQKAKSYDDKCREIGK